jgi:FAD:protein FMN transferase
LNGPFRLTRRTWLGVAIAPVIPAFGGTAQTHRFQHDHVLGTSLDLTVTGASPTMAQAAEQASLRTVERLRAVLSTYDPSSEISRKGIYGSHPRSADLEAIIAAYRHWGARTGGIIRPVVRGATNVDALGKAYIIAAAAAAARDAAPHASGLLLDIGGDMVALGPFDWPLGIADPRNPFDNSPPLTRIEISNVAVATSGSYARGHHILDPRTGASANGAAAASVVAPDCVTANALSTALCVLAPEEGLKLVSQIEGASALIVDHDGNISRSPGFAPYERPVAKPALWAGWTNGYQVSLQFALKPPQSGGGSDFGGFSGRHGDRSRRPYVAVWVEDPKGHVVRSIAVWANKWKHLPELNTWFEHNGGSENLFQMARATRGEGHYSLVWNGLDDQGKPVPPGPYRIWVETNREHGNHYQESVVIDCSGKPAVAALRETPEFEAVKINFGPAGDAA